MIWSLCKRIYVKNIHLKLSQYISQFFILKIPELLYHIFISLIIAELLFISVF